MKRTLALLILLLTLFTPVYFVLAVAYQVVLPAIIYTVLLVVGYSVYMMRSRLVAKAMKPVWLVAFILGSAVSLPAFWYLYMWRPARGNEN